VRFSGCTLCALFSFLLLFSAANMCAQTADQNTTVGAASTFKAQRLTSLSATNGKDLSPSFLYVGKSISAEVRYNWDDHRVGAACIGKPTGKDSLKLILEACGFVGNWNGFGPQVWILSETHRFSLVSYVQYAKPVDANQMGSQWGQFEGKLSRWLNLGLGGQAFQVSGSPLAVDLGPAIKLIHKRWDLSAMPMWRTTIQGRGEKRVYVGLGYEF